MRFPALSASAAPLAVIALMLNEMVSPASASCGSAFCTVNTNWNAQLPLTPGTQDGGSAFVVRNFQDRFANGATEANHRWVLVKAG